MSRGGDSSGQASSPQKVEKEFQMQGLLSEKILGAAGDCSE